MKTSFKKSCIKESERELLWLEIPDLVAQSASGGAMVGVSADASASGNDAVALTNTMTIARPLLGNSGLRGLNGGTIAFGEGYGIAIGNNPSSSVSLFGSGDRVISFVSTFATPKQSITRGFIFAIDLPRLMV